MKRIPVQATQTVARSQTRTARGVALATDPALTAIDGTVPGPPLAIARVLADATVVSGTTIIITLAQVHDLLASRSPVKGAATPVIDTGIIVLVPTLPFVTAATATARLIILVGAVTPAATDLSTTDLEPPHQHLPRTQAAKTVTTTQMKSHHHPAVNLFAHPSSAAFGEVSMSNLLCYFLPLQVLIPILSALVDHGAPPPVLETMITVNLNLLLPRSPTWTPGSVLGHATYWQSPTSTQPKPSK